MRSLNQTRCVIKVTNAEARLFLQAEHLISSFYWEISRDFCQLSSVFCQRFWYFQKFLTRRQLILRVKYRCLEHKWSLIDLKVSKWPAQSLFICYRFGIYLIFCLFTETLFVLSSVMETIVRHQDFSHL